MRDYCSDCGTTYDRRGLCACTEPDWLRAEVQRLQEQVDRLLDARTIDRLQAHGDGYQDGHHAGQEAMRERAAAVAEAEMEAQACTEFQVDEWEGGWRQGCETVADAIRALEVEHD